jgi:large subunit ribosomal protein L6
MELSVDIPSGVEIKADEGRLVVKGPKGEIAKSFEEGALKIKQSDGKIRFSSLDDRKKSRAIVGTWAAHTENMIKGVTKGYEARMKIVYSHFPIKLSVDKDTVTIGNYLGERGQRSAKIMPGTAVKLDKEHVIVTGVDKEMVGQTAANIELASRVKKRDRRVFQDGVYITHKPEPVGNDKK